MKPARLLAIALAAALAGCGATPVEYHHAGDMKPGPGMLTGETGEKVWRIDLGGTKPVAAPSEAEEFERWKRSAAGTDEYREFQDWREWQEWKRRNAR
ncbi:MAG TPA: hypothetical protein VIQ55_01255 [Burkholderiales bacterium]|jgi:hypothetical protein